MKRRLGVLRVLQAQLVTRGRWDLGFRQQMTSQIAVVNTELEILSHADSVRFPNLALDAALDQLS